MALHEIEQSVGVVVAPEVRWLVTETENRSEARNIFNGAFIPSQEKNVYYFLGRLRREDTGKLDWEKVDQTSMGYIKVRLVDGRLEEDVEYGRKVLFEAAEGKEDPRVVVKQDGTIVCGFTQVVSEGKNKVPYGAAMNLTEINGELVASPMRIYTEFGPGKNMTPTEDGFMFRPESEDGVDNNHNLVMSTTDSQGNVIHSYNMSFKDCIGGIPDWAEFKMGTTGGTVSEIMDKTGRVVEKIILVHGMKRSLKLIDGKLEEFYEYAIGAAELVIDNSSGVDEYKVKQVSRRPIIDRFTAAGEEQSDRRYVNYACDILHTEEGIMIALNKGDRTTVFVPKTHQEIAYSLN